MTGLNLPQTASAANRCAVERRWRRLENITSDPVTLRFGVGIDFLCRTFGFGCCVEGIDSIATGHWIIEFRHLTFFFAAQEFGR
ncbi:hypothetical protein [Microvirga yunnanensis]|uniref:hypothetical protein n=1 Tax=Microvirga yunnanensis TaxID=2953740 RepID=UPI0021C833AE|nr:hypothetical protein [Microvirga sp. HBU65207]